MVDPKESSLELSVAGRDFTITQSPGILQSKREGGTTGAAVWRTSVRVGEWLACPNKIFTQLDMLNAQTTVLELGSGISGIVPCILAPSVRSVVATDQPHLLKTLRENTMANAIRSHSSTGRQSRRNGSHDRKTDLESSNVSIVPLDWEQDDVPAFMTSNGMPEGVDVVIACDCIFNYALIEPFVQTCTEICRVRQQAVAQGDVSTRPTICLIAQQLRQSEVFEEWLLACMRAFRVWRMPGEMLSDGLKEGSGFAVHVAVLR